MSMISLSIFGTCLLGVFTIFCICRVAISDSNLVKELRDRIEELEKKNNS
jgi:hypothetical protein